MKHFLLLLASLFFFNISSAYSECWMPKALENTSGWTEGAPISIYYGDNSEFAIKYHFCYRNLPDGKFEAIIGLAEFEDNCGSQTNPNLCPFIEKYQQNNDTIDDRMAGVIAMNLLFKTDDIHKYPEWTAPIYYVYQASCQTYIYIDSLVAGGKFVIKPCDTSSYNKYSYQYSTIEKNDGIYAIWQKTQINDITSVDNEESSSQIQISKSSYNSTTGIVNLEYHIPNSLNNLAVLVYNYLGDRIENLEYEESGSNNISFNASNFANGLYFVQIQAEGISTICKFVKY